MADLKMRTGVGPAPVEVLSVELPSDECKRRRLFTTGAVPAGEIIVVVDGVLHPTPSRYSIQIGDGAHLDDIGPIEATNHSCEPTAYVDYTEEPRISLRAIRDLAIGAEVTIDYCATEEEMNSPFRCDCGSAACYGMVRGYRFLHPARRRRLAPWLSPYLAAKYGDGRAPAVRREPDQRRNT